MPNHSESAIGNRELSLSDFESALPSLISTTKPSVLLSDFDETLCRDYIYDMEARIHIPNIRSEIVSEAARIETPFFIATSRAADEIVVRNVSQSLSRGRNPIICENGAVVLFPATNEKVCLIDEDQKDQVEGVKRGLVRISEDFLNEDQQLVVRPNRIATIELRLQDFQGKGNSEAHGQLVDFMGQNFDLDGLDVVSSHNSVCIQPVGSNKGLGFLSTLEILGLRREDFFVIGLGDAPNDEPIFRNSNLGINVKRNPATSANFTVNAGDDVALSVMKLLR